MGTTTVSLFFLLVLYFFIYLRGIIHKPKNLNSTLKPISIVICAKNEEENLRKFLPKILEQDYPDFEVIVVNDSSSDNTDEVLGLLEQKHKNLRHTFLEDDSKFHHGKKLALTIGLKSAKHDYVVLTDADCFPKSTQWLQSIAKQYSNTVEFILGYGGYETKKGLLNKLVRYETVLSAFQYLGFAKAGMPYMGVGRNLSYKKEVFFRNKGFLGHYHIISGDDDLFVNAHATKKNTSYSIAKESHTLSVAPSNWKEWIKQKRRHLSTGHLYKTKHKIVLMIEPILKLLFYSGLIVSLFLNNNIIILSSILGTKWLFHLLVFKIGMIKFEEKGFLFFAPFFDIFYPIIQLSLMAANKITAKRLQWK
jgi:cellulose synthase/poly-beta-1,6-N-acetylglucosamine synthase-like glycosyltransferase